MQTRTIERRKRTSGRSIAIASPELPLEHTDAVHSSRSEAAFLTASQFVRGETEEREGHVAPGAKKEYCTVANS